MEIPGKVFKNGSIVQGVPKKMLTEFEGNVGIFGPLWGIQVVLGRLGQIGSFLATLDHCGALWLKDMDSQT